MFLLQGGVVQKPVNVNPGLNFNCSIIFSRLKCFSPLTFGVVWGFYSLKLQGRQYKQDTSPKSYKNEIELPANNPELVKIFLIDSNLKYYCEFASWIYFIFLLLLTTVFLGIVKKGSSWTRSMDLVHGGGSMDQGPCFVLSIPHSNTEKRVENAAHSGVFLTKFEVLNLDSRWNTVSSVYMSSQSKQKLRSRWRSTIVRIYVNKNRLSKPPSWLWVSLFWLDESLMSLRSCGC